jgi:D-aminoacyl-tRNA deacylase
VTVDDNVVGSIGAGLLVLLGVGPNDGPKQSQWLARKLAGLRIFPDADDKMNLSLVDVGGAALVVSQFTLYGNCRKGRRPSFIGAAHPCHAEPTYEAFCDDLRAEGVVVATGRFGAMMDVRLLNDGPVTLIIDSPE